MRTFAEVLVWWTASVGVWLLTLSSVSLSEVLLAAGCALLAVAGRREVQGSWAPSPGWLRWLLIVPVAVASTSGLERSPGTARTNGWVSRSGWSSSSAADQPLAHRPPRLVGKPAGTRVGGRSPAVTVIPHCSEQYGQCVAVARVLRAASAASGAGAVTPRI